MATRGSPCADRRRALEVAGPRPGTVSEWLDAEIDAHEAVAWTELGFRASDAPANTSGLDAARSRRTAGSTACHPDRRSPSGTHSIPQWLTPTASWRPFAGAAIRESSIPTCTGAGFDDEAIAWAVHGIDASEAVAWNELGVTPVEAQRQQTQGMSAMQTAKAWWKTGIPFDELADWMGAGLSPQEAAEQRAKGVTSERAAILRSLRKTQ